MTVLAAADVTGSKGPRVAGSRYLPAMSEGHAGDDRDLVAALRAGDEQAFAALIDGWSGSMLRMARLHVPTDSVAFCRSIYDRRELARRIRTSHIRG